MLENILLFLFALNFLNNGHIFLILLLVLRVSQTRALRFSRDFWVLSVFSILYFALDWFLNQSLSVLVLLSPAAFLAGCNLEPFKEERQLEKTVRILTLGMFTHVFLNYVYTVFRQGFQYLGTRHYDVWTGAVSAVTAQMVNYILLICFLGCCIFHFKCYLYLVPLLIFCIFHAVICGSRTVVVLFAVSAIVSFFAFVISERSKKLKTIILVLSVTLMILGLLKLMYELNVFHIQTIWRSSYLYHRLFSEYAIENNTGMFTSRRWATKLIFFKLILDHPFGGKQIRAITGLYAHDIWLDTADRVGLFPMTILIFYTLRMGFRILRYLKHSVSPAGEKTTRFSTLFFAAYFVLVLIQFMVEPVLIGSTILFHATCLIDGMMSIHFSRSRAAIRVPIERFGE